MSDITIDVNGYCINLRVAGILHLDDKILVCRMIDKDWWFLPGGRIKANESSLQALQRELCEEIGKSFRIVRPAVCSENFFQLDGRSFHEVCTYYDVQWTGTKDMEQPKDANEVFDWAAREDIPKLDLKPAFLKKYILNPSPNLELVIYREGDQTAEVDGAINTTSRER